MESNIARVHPTGGPSTGQSYSNGGGPALSSGWTGVSKTPLGISGLYHLQGYVEKELGMTSNGPMGL